MKLLTDYLINIECDDSINIEEVILENTKDSKKIFKVKLDGKFKYIGSKYMGENDTEEFLKKFENINSDTLIIIFGLCTGEHILKLQKKLGAFNRVLIVEPDKRVLKKFLNLESSKDILLDEKISIIAFDEENLQLYIQGFIEHESDYNNIKFASYANYDKIYTYKFNIFLKKLKNALRFFETNVATEIVFGNKFMETYLKNIKHIFQSYIINDFKDKFKFYTAIIVSAGPSLEKNITELKKVKDNSIIICGNRTLKPLIENDIIPDFMCAVDCTDAIYDMSKEYLDKNIPLVFTETTNYKLVENQLGKKIFFKYGAVKTNIENILNHKVDMLYSGGSVAHSCVDFAKYLGCNKIIFVGQDLAYTNNCHHAKITESSIDENINYNLDLIEVEDIYGGTVFTTRVLDNFKRTFEEYISCNKNIKFINSTEGGAKIEGTEIMDLRDSINEYCVNSDIDEIINNVFEKNNKINNMNIIKNNIHKNYENIKEIYQNIKELNFSINDTLKVNDIYKMKKIYKSIKKLNYKIDNCICMEFIEFLMVNIISKSSYYFRYKESKLEIENLRNILNGFNNLYKNLVEAMEEIIPQIKLCIETLEDDKDEF
ncbi:motility associated factor glycosyltransferase family protein [Clostridium botulinum]|uniref:Motility associated factor glycosyltransferase family protein n=2 Tax=Clostridium botulinum TaxID=1491 RepID=A0A846JR87_CLOBO|nr:6-hydroxymethylpterin diphosphokinase MptE-like protein [Clostridium botulinum]KAI3350327.1 DUF115 domain-containing protein [Clostridium botulinum]KOM88170.1 hypothetical protein ACP51_09090 [Clostridium botulinum]KOR55448.1 hypothetical protein ADT22_16855 [Clostridium botulinum]MBN1034633.1 DUF115 domain-containing protein [Clostridium botulinum]MBY7023866.1 motility associated factor glycosyltransferase family protein [Clostridium botulinum]